MRLAKTRLLCVLIFAVLIFVVASPSTSVSSGHSARVAAPAVTCTARYDAAVVELRAKRARACLEKLDALARRCVTPDDAVVRRKAFFLQAEVLLLSGEWDACAHAARLAQGTRHSSRAELLIANAASHKKTHAGIASDVAAGRNARATKSANSLLKKAPRAVELYVLRARAAVASHHCGRSRFDVVEALRLDPTNVAARLVLSEALRRCFGGAVVATADESVSSASAAASDVVGAVSGETTSVVLTYMSRALQASQEVLRDCLRVDPGNIACSVRRRLDTDAIETLARVAAAEKNQDWISVETLIDKFKKQFNPDGGFKLETDCISCRAMSWTARDEAAAAAGEAKQAEARAYADKTIRVCGAVIDALAGCGAQTSESFSESSFRESKASSGVSRYENGDRLLCGDPYLTSVELVNALVRRGWARLLVDHVDGAEADAIAARKAARHVANFRGARGVFRDDKNSFEDDFDRDEAREDEDDEAQEDEYDFDEDTGDIDEPPNNFRRKSFSSSTSVVLDDESSLDLWARVERLVSAVAAAKTESKKTKDLYQVLGLSKLDSLRSDWKTLLKRAYRQLALLYHPDKNPHDPDRIASVRFLEISEAYKILSSDDARRAYDGGDANFGDTFGDFQTRGRDGSFPENQRHGNSFSPPKEDSNKWTFRFDKRDVASDGIADGVWKDLEGNQKFGKRDVSPVEKENPCASFEPGTGGRKGSRFTNRIKCLPGSGGTPPPGVQRGAVRALKLKIVKSNGPRNAAAGSLITNLFGLQTLEFRFTVAHDEGTEFRNFDSLFHEEGGKEKEPRVSVSPMRAVVRQRTALLVARVYEKLTEGEQTFSGQNDFSKKKNTLSNARCFEIAAAAAGGAADDAYDPENVLAESFQKGITTSDLARNNAVVDALKALAESSVHAMFARGALSSRFETRSSFEKQNENQNQNPPFVDPRTRRARGLLRDEKHRHIGGTDGTVAMDTMDTTFHGSRDTTFPGSRDTTFPGSKASVAAVEAAGSLCDTKSFLVETLAVPGFDERRKATLENAASRLNRFVSASWGEDFMDGSGYLVREGDVLAYEIKWGDVTSVDADDPVMGVNPVGGERAETETSAGENTWTNETARAETREDENTQNTTGPLFHDRAAYVSLDVQTEDGFLLSRTGAVDQHGLRAGASSDLTRVIDSKGEGGWYVRRVVFPAVFVGKNLKRWIATCERDTPSRIRASIRHVRVLGENGEEAYVALASEGGTLKVEEERY